MRSWLCALLPLLLGACLSIGERRELQPVGDPQVLAFANQIEGFYRGLEGLPLDVIMVFEDEELRAHFATPQAFVDYYASLTNQVREAQFRNTRAHRVEIRDFRFENPEQAIVGVVFVGRHLRVLRFWEIETARSDTWQLIDGGWMLTPEKL